ncbi:MAG TPA: Fic family protein, partial [Anaerolineae bacterium]|nr:Fic family protein [Anaerolineae bacterium]
ITGSKYSLPSPGEIPELMRGFIIQLSDMKEKMHPVEFSAIAHNKFVFIHPFIDGNGRVARLLMNILLLQDGYNIALISPAVRPEYIQSLEKARKDDRAFIEFIARMVKETQKDYLRIFR